MLVTGGEGGIGEAIVKGIAAENGIPIIVGRAQKNGEYLQKCLRNKGHDCLFIQTELTELAQCQRAVDITLEHYGKIDVLINNAGFNDKVGLEEGNVTDFVHSLESNLVHYFNMAKLALPALKQSKGNIINISSKTALTGQGGTSGYVASKSAQLGLTREWAVELLKYDIRVNAVIPAEVLTPHYEKWISSFNNSQERMQEILQNIPFQNRMTKRSEIADMVLFLSSNRSSHVTGQFVHVDGGYVHLDRSIHSLNAPPKSEVVPTK